MIKTFSPVGWSFDGPNFSLVKCASRGLRGHDWTQFVKRAGVEVAQVFAPFFKDAEFKDGDYPVHCLALGAHETWGPNWNGDTFTRKAAERYHPTFVKFAKWFRNHKNKPDSPFYGRVKASAYNPTMDRIELLVALNGTKEAADRNGGFIADREIQKLASGKDIAVSMACGRKGTLVQTRDRRWQKIENVVAGDYVLTHRGRFRRVTATAERVRQQIVKIKARGLGRTVLEFTPDHEFFVARFRDLPVSPYFFNGQTSTHPSGFSRPYRAKNRKNLAAHARWVPCGELQPEDYLLLPIPRGGNNSSLTVSQARTLGYYIAEGSMAEDYPCFTVNKQDVAVAELAALYPGQTKAAQHTASVEAVNVYIYSKPVGRFLAQTVGRRLENKSIPSLVWNAPADVKLEFLSAWFNGDGWQDLDGLHWSTASKTLSIELQLLLASVGIPASVNVIAHTSDLPHGVKRERPGLEYVVSASNSYSAMFAGKSKAVVIAKRQQASPNVFITGDYLAARIASVTLIERECEVVDLTVDEDESFTAYGVAVHNCLVPHDVCSACGNQAPKRDDYCTASTCPGGGCKEALTKLYKEGQDTKQLFVYNPTPKFFDITNVESDRPADRTAYAAPADWLSKSAADTWAQWPGAEAAEAQNITAPLEVLADRDSQFLNDAQRQIAKVATGLAALETQGPVSEFALRGIPSYRTLSEAPMVSTKEACQWLAAWADQGIILPLAAFAAFTKRASCANAARAHLPGLYSRLLSSGAFDSGLRDNPYTLLDSVPGLQQKQAAYQLAPSLSLRPDHVQRRAMFAIFGQQPVPAVIGSVHEKQASIETPETAKLLRDYAIYKAASLTRMLLSGSLGDAALLTSQLAVCQDRLL